MIPTDPAKIRCRNITASLFAIRSLLELYTTEKMTLAAFF
jgi:hypothetical protein